MEFSGTDSVKNVEVLRRVMEEMSVQCKEGRLTGLGMFVYELPFKTRC